MNLNKYDDILKAGLKDFVAFEYANIPNEDEINYTFSEKYEKAKAALLAKIDKPLWKYTNTLAKRVAIIIMCFLIATTSLLSVEAIRKKIVEFFYTVFDTHTQIDYDKDIKTIEKYYIFNNLPDDYKMVLNSKNPNGMFYTFENSKSQMISFEQLCNNRSSSINSEAVATTEKIVNDTPCLVVVQDYAYIYYWEYDNYSFMLSYPLDLGEEYAEKVIGKLVETETEN